MQGTLSRRCRSSSPWPDPDQGVSYRPLSKERGAKLTKEQERRITELLVRQEFRGSKESGIYSTSSCDEEEGESKRSRRVSGSPVGGRLVEELRRRSTKMGLLWQHR